MHERTGISSYAAFSDYLETMLRDVQLRDNKAIKSALDGQAGSVLRTTMSLKMRREIGAFFTGSKLSAQLSQYAAENLENKKIILDPTCGAADLLLGIARHLPLEANLNLTIKAWGTRLYGFDKEADFIRVAKLRLLLLAATRHNCQTAVELKDSHFTNLKVGDVLENLDVVRKADCILFNPPYGGIVAPKDCLWAEGKITAAAWYASKIIENAKPSSHIYSILPEVLRCGSRYKKFRQHTFEKCVKIFSKSIGLFDPWTDVDVFISEYCKKTPGTSVLKEKSLSQVGDFFEIRVGPVVPFRDKKNGKKYLYVDVTDLPTWKDFFPTRTRKYKGTVFKPPFVVIRRTSRPGDLYRAIGTIIRSNAELVAVENHLIVAKPFTGGYRECQKLLQILKSDATNKHLNDKMRCRHLTTSSVKEIPWND